MIGTVLPCTHSGLRELEGRCSEVTSESLKSEDIQNGDFPPLLLRNYLGTWYFFETWTDARHTHMPGKLTGNSVREVGRNEV